MEVAAPAKMAHDDVIGESIDEHEASQVRLAACICLERSLKKTGLNLNKCHKSNRCRAR